MDLVVGAILDGKVTSIMKFGAFVSLPGGKSGLVHISEIAYSYVNEVSDFLSEGQEVKVKVIGIDENGRINLSIRKTQDPPPQQAPRHKPAQGGSFSSQKGNSRAPQAQTELSFEDRLKQFMADSDSKISGIRQYERKSSRRGRNGR
jgi:S1 RNA binding domain protein